jgi:hypothetical protein
MIFLKRIDFAGQLVLLSAAVIFISIDAVRFLVPAYVTVGCWQFLSCLFNYLRRDGLLRQKSRHFFEAILIAVPIFLIIWLLYPSTIRGVSFILVCISPLLAAWYCYITYMEMNVWEARALIQLR